MNSSHITSCRWYGNFCFLRRRLLGGWGRRKKEGKWRAKEYKAAKAHWLRRYGKAVQHAHSSLHVCLCFHTSANYSIMDVMSTKYENINNMGGRSVVFFYLVFSFISLILSLLASECVCVCARTPWHLAECKTQFCLTASIFYSPKYAQRLWNEIGLHLFWASWVNGKYTTHTNSKQQTNRIEQLRGCIQSDSISRIVWFWRVNRLTHTPCMFNAHARV